VSLRLATTKYQIEKLKSIYNSLFHQSSSRTNVNNLIVVSNTPQTLLPDLFVAEAMQKTNI
jgi:hypothetical protein